MLIKLYVNGQFHSQQSIGNDIFIVETLKFKINALQQTAGSTFSTCKCVIDDVRLYATVLTASDVLGLYQAPVQVDKNGSVFCNELVELDNIFDADVIIARANELNTGGTKPRITQKLGLDCIAIKPTPFYSGGTYYSIFQNGSFKTNTRYLFCLRMNANVIYNSVEVGGGMRVMYSDGSIYDIVAKTADRWKEFIYISDANKTIDKIGIYYYTDTEVYYSLDSKIVEYVPFGANRKGQLVCSAINEVTPYVPSIVDYSNWNQLGTGSVGNWGMNATTANECERMLAGNPWGELDYIWVAPGNDAASDSDGGFNNGGFTIDNTKKYRLSVWMRREIPSGSYNGTTYFGCGGVANLSDGLANGNPYFKYLVESDQEWKLWVAYILPYNSAITTSDPTSGIYKLDGTKYQSCTDFKWASSSQTTGSTRAYLFYSTNTAEMEYFYRPRVEICDGSEPTIDQLLKGEEHSSLYLSKSNKFAIDKCGRVYTNKASEI
jgi:hypothetical protein